jgi:hypothetical protein
VKTVEFEASLGDDKTLQVPDDVAAQVPSDRPMRVILVLPDAGQADEAAWAHVTAEQFLSGYDDSDAIYDDVPAR